MRMIHPPERPVRRREIGLVKCTPSQFLGKTAQLASTRLQFAIRSETSLQGAERVKQIAALGCMGLLGSLSPLTQ